MANITRYNKYKLACFNLKFQGLTYLQMVDHPDVNHYYSATTLESYFAKNGEWYDEFSEWCAKKIVDIEDSVRKMLTAQAQTMAQMLITIGSGNTKRYSITTLKAAQDVLDRAGFQVTKRVELDTPADDIAEATMKALEKRKAERKAREQAAETVAEPATHD